MNTVDKKTQPATYTKGNFLYKHNSSLRIDTLFPASDGSTTEFTPSGSSDHYANVDDTVLNDTDFNYEDTEGHVDLFNYEDLTSPSNTNILGVVMNSTVRKTDAGEAPFASVYYDTVGADEYYSSPLSGTDYGVPNSYITLQTIWNRNPVDNQVWEDNDLNSHQFGIMMSGV